MDPSLAEQESFDQHSIPGELVLMKVYLDKAKQVWASKPGSETTLDFVRKIAGIAVRCMEHQSRQTPLDGAARSGVVMSI